MKLKEIDKLSPGDILVFTKYCGRVGFKLGHELIFHKFHKMVPTSASSIYFSEIGSDEIVSFAPGICKFIDTKQKVRDRKLNDILNDNTNSRSKN